MSELVTPPPRAEQTAWPSSYQHMRRTWYVVPDYRADGEPATSATVVNRAGELVATFESLEDAERAVEAVNGRT